MLFQRIQSRALPIFRVSPISRAYSSAQPENYLGDALSLDIPTVPLIFDKHVPKKPTDETSQRSPLIFLHGLFGSRSNNRSVARMLADSMDREVYCVDLRNFGDSPHTKQLDYPALAADLENFVYEQKFTKKPILVGHSMGAKTVMAAALRRPDLPKMVVSVDNAPIASFSATSPFSKYIRQLRQSLEVEKRTKMSEVDADLAKVEPALEVRQFILKNVSSGKKDDVCKSKIPLDVIGDAVVKGTIASWPYDPSVAKWTRGPTLFVRGTKSEYVPDEAIPDIASYFPDFEVRDVDSGHWVISEKPREFMELLKEWIERKEDD